MKKLTWLIIWFFAMLVLSWCGAQTTIETVSSPAIIELATCLTNNGATFYGTERCPHCKDQKRLFGEAMSQVNYIDCDQNGPVCQWAWVKGYPTWIFADGWELVGMQTLEALAVKAGCSFAPEALIPQG